VKGTLAVHPSLPPPCCCGDPGIAVLAPAPQGDSADVAFKLSRLRMKMLTGKRLGGLFQMNLVYEQLARRLIMGNEFKRLAERARRDFREVRPWGWGRRGGLLLLERPP
jgi:hypothetical protein